MPKAWSAKDERKYEHILEACTESRGKRKTKLCKRIAAATVNRDRTREGRTKAQRTRRRKPRLGCGCAG